MYVAKVATIRRERARANWETYKRTTIKSSLGFISTFNPL
jgi:hypothetical protein